MPWSPCSSGMSIDRSRTNRPSVDTRWDGFTFDVHLRRCGMTFEELKEKALTLPLVPGVYIMRDKK